MGAQPDKQDAEEAESDRFPPVTAEGRPYVVHNPGGASPILLTCDHATPALPLEYGTLGLDPSVFEDHIAYDLGAASLTLALADRLDCIAVLANFSRLLIDPNRAPDHETLIPVESDKIPIPANERADEAEKAHRRRAFFDPYHEAVEVELAKIRGRGDVPIMAGIHSFVSIMQGAGRPWHAGILWNKDPRLARRLLDALRRDPDISVGDNLPYSGRVLGYGMDAHGGIHGYPNAVIEVRQDLLGSDDGIAQWADRLAPILDEVSKDEELAEIRHYEMVPE